MTKFLFVCLFLFLSGNTSTGPPTTISPTITIQTDLFEEAVTLIKQYEGWHPNHYPYVGYGHRLINGEKFGSDISEGFADSLLRNDLKQKCSVFREFGKDSLLLAVLSYNVGEFNLLGFENKPRSLLIRKLETGNREIKEEYLSYRKANGEILRALSDRRKAEFDLLFDKTKTFIIKLKFTRND